MKKRIRLHQLRVGMFLDEIEMNSNCTADMTFPFLVSSPDDVNRLATSPAISAVIDTAKGIDINGGLPPGFLFDPDRFEVELHSRFSSRQIKQARKTIEETKPIVRKVLTAVHDRGSMELEEAGYAVDLVMAEAMSNAGALLGVVKLKSQDEETFLHSLAVSALTITFARKLKMDEQAVRLLGLGGLVHDLGKMTLPLELLRKPGRLTAEELALIRLHPERGHDLMSKVPEMPQAILDICLYHHEKYDGSGYPRGLKGGAIPYLARLAAVCDVYDALTSVRPYKRAWTKAEAIHTMLNSKGHFDPKLLSAFMSEMVSGTLH